MTSQIQNLMTEKFFSNIGDYLPKLIGAICVLVVGWLAAVFLARIAKEVFARCNCESKLAKWLAGDEKGKEIKFDFWASMTVYYLTMLFVLVAFFQTLGLTIITDPFKMFLNNIFEYFPQIIGALLILLLAWGTAAVLRLIFTRGLQAVNFDKRVALGMEVKEVEAMPLAKTIGDVVYWLVFLLFLPMILGVLKLNGLLVPVQSMLNKILAFLPQLIAAGVILLLGWFMARVIERIVANLVAVAGGDQLSAKVGLAPMLGRQKLSGLVGLLVYILVLIPVVLAAFDALGLESITRPFSDMLQNILVAVPKVFAAGVLLIIAYMVGSIVGGFATNLLNGSDFNSLLFRLGLGKEPPEGDKTLSEMAGKVVLAAVMLFAFIQACELLTFQKMAALSSELLLFAAHILIGVAIFLVGVYLANLAAGAIKAGRGEQTNFLAWVSKVAILLLAAAMALRQMGIANEIIQMAFTLVVGAVAVAAAIAFGVGGRDLAARKLEKWNEELKGKGRIFSEK